MYKVVNLDDYVCTSCGIRNVKMWRMYSSFTPDLHCKKCSMKKQNKSEEDLEGTDQIGWRVPAVPTEDNTAYWGYTSVPVNAVEWWTNLPEQ